MIISPNVKVPSPGPGVDGPTEASFKFRCQRSNSDFLVTAREMLEQYLISHNAHVYPSATSRTHQRTDSFTDAFPHFDSKVLSTARTRHQSESLLLVVVYVRRTERNVSDSADLGRPSEAMIDRRLRLASSSPDVKALFNNNTHHSPAPSYIYHLEEEEDFDTQANYVPSHNTDYWTPLPPIVSLCLIPRPEFAVDQAYRALGCRLVHAARKPSSVVQIRSWKRS